MTTPRDNVPVSILLVEDDRLMAAMCAAALDNAGFKVEVAANGIEALDRLERSGFDIVITDMSMPRLGGNGLYQAAVAKYPRLKERFIFMSGDFTEVRLPASMQAGRRIEKPFKVADLLDHVNAVAQSRH